MGSRWTWRQIREHEDFQGRWVALDDCRYDVKTARPIEGSVVDVDEDLVALCNRLQDSNNRHCAILFCEESSDDEVSVTPSPKVFAYARPHEAHAPSLRRR